MIDKYAEQLRAMQRRLENAATRLNSDFESRLDSLEAAATEVAAAWSGSSIGYHANVYYLGLGRPPAGAHFSSEWGLMGGIISPGTSGEWREHAYEDVEAVIRERAGHPDLGELTRASDEVAAAFRDEQSRFESIMSAATAGVSDD